MRTIDSINQKLHTLRIDVELTLRQIHPYNRLIEMDNEGNELIYNEKYGYFEAVNFRLLNQITED